jgi:copper(I)-binding protein
MNERTRMILVAMTAVLTVILLSLAFSGCERVPPMITLQNARVEFSQAMKDEASIYLTITNEGGPDKLLGARVSIPGATADIHQMNGIVMLIVKEFDIPAHSAIDFRAGTSHLMIMGVPADVGQGSKFTLTLKFEKSGEMSLPITFNSPRPQPKTVMSSPM